MHDRLTGLGGGELFVFPLAKHYNADVFTARYDREKALKLGFEEPNVNALLKGSPTEDAAAQSGVKRMQEALAFSRLDLSDYDAVVLSGNWAVFSARKNKDNLWYCHTPTRSIYDLHYFYLQQLREKSMASAALFKAWSYLWTPIDQRNFSNVNKVAVNSRNVGLRVQRYYGRDDYSVINPLIFTESFKPSKPKGYYLSVTRITPMKRLDLQLDVFEELPKEELVIVGTGDKGSSYQKRFQERVKKMHNVTWLENVSQRELIDLYAHCKAVIQTPMFEDFGRVPVEANASGKACLAVNEEGMTESIVHGKTGLLIEQPYRENFTKAIKNFDSLGFKEKDCVENAKRFSEKEFFKKFDAALSSVLA